VHAAQRQPAAPRHPAPAQPIGVQAIHGTQSIHRHAHRHTHRRIHRHAHRYMHIYICIYFIYRYIYTQTYTSSRACSVTAASCTSSARARSAHPRCVLNSQTCTPTLYTDMHTDIYILTCMQRNGGKLHLTSSQQPSPSTVRSESNLWVLESTPAPG
jgi:hypothetical protein